MSNELMAIIGFGLSIIGIQYTYLRNFKIDIINMIEARMDKLEARMDKFETRMDKFDEKLLDIDRRLCRIEGAMSSKDCCMLKEDAQHRKAE